MVIDITHLIISTGKPASAQLASQHENLPLFSSDINEGWHISTSQQIISTVKSRASNCWSLIDNLVAVEQFLESCRPLCVWGVGKGSLKERVSLNYFKCRNYAFIHLLHKIIFIFIQSWMGLSCTNTKKYIPIFFFEVRYCYFHVWQSLVYAYKLKLKI